MKTLRTHAPGWLLLLGGCAALAGCNETHSTPPPLKPADVLVTQPVTREITDHEVFTGRTQAISTITIRARVTGYLTKVAFKEGAEVKEGDLLFEIDPRPYQAQLDQAKADLANKKAATVKAEALLKRSIALVRTGAATQEDIDNQRGDFEVAKAAVSQAEAKLREAQLNLDWTLVHSPINGRISYQMIDPGNLVTADQTALTTLVSVDPIYVYFDVDERTLLKLRRLIQDGKIMSARTSEVQVDLGLADEEGFSCKGIINFADNKVDPTTGTLRVRAIFPNPKGFLSPGLFARVRVRVGAPHQAILIPERALGTDQGRKFLYVVNDKDEVVYRSVKIGSQHEGLRVIEEGLSSGEKVIVSGLQRVRPGAKVHPSIDPKAGDHIANAGTAVPAPHIEAAPGKK